jgi:protein O-mannosyl-transferase
VPFLKRITPERAVLIGAILAALAYVQDIRYDFILDDVPLILMNETIGSWRNWKRVFVTDIFSDTNPGAILSAGTAAHYRPIYKIWQMLNAQLFGAVLPWWHVTSILLHVAVVFLIYQVGIRLFKDRWAAALAALLFAVHPVHAESVAYVTASTDLLVTLFSLIAFLAYYELRERGASLAYFLTSVLAAGLAVLSKETAVMFPWMLVAYEAVRETPAGETRTWKNFLWTVPYFAVVGAYVAVRTMLFGMNAGPGPSGGSRLAALLDMPLVLIVYLRNLVWPFQLSFFYPSEWSTEWTVLKCLAVVLAIVAAWLLWRRYRGNSGVRLQLLWTAILFVPPLLGVYAFVHDDWVHDRHMYLVSVPLCLLAGVVLTDRRVPSRAAIFAGAVMLIILLADLIIQVPRFTDNVSIYASAAKVAPRSLLLHAYYGMALSGYGRREEALREYRIAAEIAPQSAKIREWCGGALADLGRDDEARAEYEKAVSLSTEPAARAYVDSRIAELELKHLNLSEAEAHLRDAVRLDPQAAQYHALLARALNQEGQIQEAEEEMKLEASLRQKTIQERRAEAPAYGL